MSIPPALAEKIRANAKAAYEFSAIKEFRRMLNGGGTDATWHLVMSVAQINNEVSQDKLFSLINHQPNETEETEYGLKPISCRELFNMEIEDLYWNINSILPAGTTLLFGKPKKGKSFLSMMISLSVSARRDVFGKQTSGKKVLYLGLEDSTRRLKRRAMGCANSLGIPPGDFQDNLYVTTTSKRMDNGLIGELEQWMSDHPDTGLIVVDMLKKITMSSVSTKKMSLYEVQGLVGEVLTKFSHNYPELSIIVVHHSRKAESEDPFDLVSGTTGLSGSYDSLAAIADSEGIRTLHITGRDLEGAEIPLMMNERGMYTLEMPDPEEIAMHGMSSTRKRVYEAIPRSQIYTRQQIIEGCGIDEKSVDQQLSKLTRDGLVEKKERGSYVRTKKRFYDEPVKKF